MRTEVKLEILARRLRKPKLVNGNTFVPSASQRLLWEGVSYSTKAKSCRGECFCSLRKPKAVKGNAFVLSASQNLLR